MLAGELLEAVEEEAVFHEDFGDVEVAGVA